MDPELRALYERQAQLRKEREDLDAERELLFALLASVTEKEISETQSRAMANAEGEMQ